MPAIKMGSQRLKHGMADRCPLSKAKGFRTFEGRKDVERMTDVLAKCYDGARVDVKGLRRK
jgi:hypothetical protein